MNSNYRINKIENNLAVIVVFQICSTGYNAHEIVNKTMFKSTAGISTTRMKMSITFVEKWNGGYYVSNKL